MAIYWMSGIGRRCAVPMRTRRLGGSEGRLCFRKLRFDGYFRRRLGFDEKGASPLGPQSRDLSLDNPIHLRGRVGIGAEIAVAGIAEAGDYVGVGV
jgi:hypothetical protein